MSELIARLRGKLFILTCKILRKNIQIGKGLEIYKKFCIRGNGKIKIGENCIVDGIVGDNSQYVSFDTHSEEAVVSIGNNAKLFAARISARFQIKIGNDLIIEESGIVDTDFHTIGKNRKLPSDENIENCKIEIGNLVSIGARSIITKGIMIGDGATIGPGSIVNKSIKPGTFVMGNPAKQLKI